MTQILQKNKQCGGVKENSCGICGRSMQENMDSSNIMEDSELHTLEQLDESEVLQASRDPFKDNNTVCKCRGMCLRERG